MTHQENHKIIMITSRQNEEGEAEASPSFLFVACFDYLQQ